jgi:hypothetical protein
LAGGTLSADEVGQILGITRQAVDKRRRAGIPEVVRGFSSASPWVKLDLLLTPDTVLVGRTPLEALKAGDSDEVVRLVHGLQGDAFA